MKYKICTTCVMDTTDPWIEFDEAGQCNHCRRFENELKPHWFPNDEGRRRLEAIAETIKEQGKGRDHDCIIGVSGGVDSSYVLHLAKKELGLRPLAVHVDAGWNSELAVRNIENLTQKLQIELFTYVVNWQEMKDLQVAYLKSSLANQDVPQDHAFFAKLYEFAVQNRIKHVLTGANFATESILPRAWGYNAKDSHQLRSIHRKFGRKPLKDFPIAGYLRSYLFYPIIKGMKVVNPLNLIEFNKDKAMELLSSEYDWVYYGGKHFESRWTRFFQSYYLPKKFGYDKRRAHLASLVVSGQITRDKALAELQQPPYNEETIDEDIEFIAKKLGLSVDEFRGLLELPNKEFTDYPNLAHLEKFLRQGKRLAMRLGISV